MHHYRTAMQMRFFRVVKDVLPRKKKKRLRKTPRGPAEERNVKFLHKNTSIWPNYRVCVTQNSSIIAHLGVCFAEKVTNPTGQFLGRTGYFAEDSPKTPSGTKPI